MMASQVSPEPTPIQKFFESAFQERVQLSPQTMTRLGLPGRQDELDDMSPSAAEQTRQLHQEQLRRLQQFDFDTLDSADKLNYRLFEREAKGAIACHGYRNHHHLINQKFGLHTDFPAFMISLHGIEDRRDADNYLSRLRALEPCMQQVIEGLRIREELGVVPPKYLFSQIIDDCQAFIRSGAVGNALYRDFEAKLEGLSSGRCEERSRLLQDCCHALNDSVLPGYQRLIDYLLDQQARAPEEGGAGRLPAGEGYYAACLAEETSTALTADEIYRYGLEEVDRIQAEMLALRPALGVQGDLQALFKHVREAPEFYFPQSELGRADCLAMFESLIEAMQPRLPELFHELPQDRLEVRAVEGHRENTAGLAFYQGPGSDGRRPGVFYANLHDLEQLPTFVLEALAYHEAVPGHHMQFSIANRLKDLPSFRRHLSHNAYIEGWALYAELICREIGLYDDPWADFGRLDQELKRACRLVADTGVHSRGWTREQTVSYLHENTPAPWAQARMEADRYVVMPGQATSYKIGMQAILDLRSKARAELGELFDLRLFHDELLRHGPLPLDLLAEQIEQWITSQR